MKKSSFQYLICFCLTLVLLLCTGQVVPATVLPILMYHDIQEVNPSGSSWTVTTDQFWQDMVFLEQNGYTTLLPSDLVAIANGQRAMPDKPVVVTFDDGYETNYIYGQPVLEATGVKAALAVITIAMREDSDPDSAFLTWSEVREMSDSGCWEIGSHTHNLHKQREGRSQGIQRGSGETQAAYQARVGADLQESIRLIEERTGKKVTYFANPHGAKDNWFLAVEQAAGILVSTSTKWGLADTSDGLYSLPRYTVTANWPASRILTGSRVGINRDAAGRTVRFSAGSRTRMTRSYLIDNYRYVNVRDLATVLGGTDFRFSVVWDPALEVTKLRTTARYTAGVENPPVLTQADGLPELSRLEINGMTKYFTAYRIDGQLYYKLRDLADAMNFGVSYDAAQNTVSVSKK